jgi:TetR/AcrR family transcriptional regulator, cholesterol catabolism regulator
MATGTAGGRVQTSPSSGPSSDPSSKREGRLERSQRARREQLVQAVLDLAREGGYDAIQLRSISERTGISTDTIYRYYGSRDQLISAAVEHWSEIEFLTPAATWLTGDTPAEQLLEFTRNVWAVWERHPAMLETYVRAALAEGGLPDGLAARAMEEIPAVMLSALAGVDETFQRNVLMVLEHATHSAMTYVVRGQLAIADVFPIMEGTIRLLAQHPAMARARPASWTWQPAGPRSATRSRSG